MLYMLLYFLGKKTVCITEVMHLVTRFLLTNEEPDMLKCMYLAMDKRLVIPTVCALQPTFGTLRVAICWH